MKKQSGLTINLIPSNHEFYILAVICNVLMFATLFLLLANHNRFGTYEFLDLENFEMSKVTFRGTMGPLVMMMAFGYVSQLWRCVYSPVIFKPVVVSSERIRLEIGTVYGYLTLVCFLLNLFGLWGFVYLPVTPPVLFSLFRFAMKSKKESQDYI